MNSEPYGDGFLFQIKAADEGELANLLDAAAYQASIDEYRDHAPCLLAGAF